LPTQQPNRQPLIIAAHGDVKKAPENTLPAIEAAIANGADIVEIDIRLTADGVPVLMHDESTERTTDREASVARLSYDELRSFDAGSWFSPEYAGTPVPTLEEALGTAAGRICVIADIKVRPTHQLIGLLRSFRSCATEARSVCGKVISTIKNPSRGWVF
jgi:glycerophosphoryl diester phosphodiesterase